MLLIGLLGSRSSFCQFLHFPQADSALSGADSWVGGQACIHSRILWISPTDCPVRLEVSLTTIAPRDFYSQRFSGFSFLHGTLGGTVCLASQLFLHAYLHANVGVLVPQPPPHQPHQLQPFLVSSPPRFPISTHPNCLDKCFFFNSLVFGLTCSLIFWQFWLLLLFF